MNRYNRYPGDYLRDTAELSMLEHGAYTLLLDTAYATEANIPVGYERVYRIVRATTEDEQAAARFVVDRFFPVGADGERHNGRVDREIPKAIKQIEASRANGLLGGRPKIDNPVETQPVKSGFDLANLTPKLPSPSPIKTKTTRPATIMPDGFGVTEAHRVWATKTGQTRLDEHMAYFKDYATANRKTYADWDAAFRNCVRGNWAKLPPATAKVKDWT